MTEVRNRRTRRASAPRARRTRRGAAAAAPPAERRLATRDALLGEAAAQFNARGISSVSVNDVARRVGLTRAAVYYYIADREDLVFQCYMRACQLLAEDLARAQKEGADDLRRVEALVRRMLSPERPTAAVVSEIPYLSEPMRALVEKENRRNVDALQEFILSGIRAGAIRDCDALVVAQAILGILNWVVLSPGWVEERDPRFMSRIATALVDLLENGLAASPDAEVRCTIDVKSLAAQNPTNMFDRESAAAFKADQLLETASRLFNQRGLDGVSLDDIAAALGATKGAFYYYFSDKRELILRCYERSAALDEKFADVAETVGRNGLERGMIGLHLNVQAQIGGPSPLVPLIGFESLAPGPRKALQKRLTQLAQRFTRIGEQGIADGSNRRCDVEALALAGAGMFGWIPKWLPTEGVERKWEIADQMVALYTHGLRRK
jgi:AcrR family transcriptional regulator